MIDEEPHFYCKPCGTHLPKSAFEPSTLARRQRKCSSCHGRLARQRRNRDSYSTILWRIRYQEYKKGNSHLEGLDDEEDVKRVIDESDRSEAVEKLSLARSDEDLPFSVPDNFKVKVKWSRE